MCVCVCVCVHVKYPLFLSDFSESWKFLDRFSKNRHIENLMEIRPVGAELCTPGGRTNITKLRVAFCSFATAPKHGIV